MSFRRSLTSQNFVHVDICCCSALLASWAAQPKGYVENSVLALMLQATILRIRSRALACLSLCSSVRKLEENRSGFSRSS
jgi:hypothetical protein